MKILIVVESPSKCKKIENYLNNGIKKHKFTVISTVGHIMNLPRKKLSIDIEDNFKPNFEIVKEDDNLKTVKILQDLARKSDKIILASDNDREGERISYDVIKILGLDINKKNRMIFNEITENVIVKSFKNLKTLDINTVNSQIARRVLDRLIGYKISPCLRKQIQSDCSAGRVLSITTKIIYDRKKEIDDHKVDSFYQTTGTFHKEKVIVENAELNKKFNDNKTAKKFLNGIKNETFTVNTKKISKSSHKPPAPFITSTINQASSYSVKKTSAILQKLYMAGHITYIRTDSTSMSKDAQKKFLTYIKKEYGEKYPKERFYNKKVKGSQDAHECIRPTKISMSFDKISNSEQRTLYTLIWKRTVASQMSDNEQEVITLKIGMEKHKELFIKKYFKTIFDGWKILYPQPNENDLKKEFKNISKNIDIDDVVKYVKIISKEIFTKHVGRYTESSLVRKLESLGIGRPSTYNSAVSNIQNKGYVIKKNIDGKKIKSTEMTLKSGKITEKNVNEILNAEYNKLVLTELGRIVMEYMLKHFQSIMNYNYTANVESDLDLIAEGKKQGFHEVVKKYYDEFMPEVEKLKIKKGTGDDGCIGTYKGKKFYRTNTRFGSCVRYGERDDKDILYLNPEPGTVMSAITLKDAIKLMPLIKGKFEGKEISLRFGKNLYIKHGKDNYPINDRCLKQKSKEELTLKELVECIKSYRTYKKSKEQGTGSAKPYKKYKKKGYKKYKKK